VFGRAPSTAGLVCLIRADSLAESNWTVSLADCDDFRLRHRADDYNDFATKAVAIKLDSHFLQPRQPGASGRHDRAEFVDDHLFSNSDCGVLDPPQEVT
jgi:hypothetical protein